MAVVTVAGIIVYFAAHGGREIGAHIVDTDAPGTAGETVALADAATTADAQAAGSHQPEAP